jgi:hypothetical protein
MLASLALISLFQAPALGADGLSIAQPRLTYGILGPTRPNSVFKPGDLLVLAYDVQGIAADAAGKAVFTSAVEVADGSGKPVVKQPPRKIQEFMPLGGAATPAFSQITIGLDWPPGKFTLTATVTDGTSGKSAQFKQEFTVSPKGFDVVGVNITGDADGRVPVGAYVVGQPFWAHAAVVGFSRSAAKQPKVSVQLTVVGADKKPFLSQPFAAGAIDKDVPADAASLPIRFFVPLNRAGDFTIQITAKDELSGKTSTVDLPITVLPSK